MTVLHTSDLINDPVSVLLFLEARGLDGPGLEVKGQVKRLGLYSLLARDIFRLVFPFRSVNVLLPKQWLAETL